MIKYQQYIDVRGRVLPTRRGTTTAGLVLLVRMNGCDV